MKIIYIALEPIKDRPEATKIKTLDVIDSPGVLSHVVIWRDEWENQGGE